MLSPALSWVRRCTWGVEGGVEPAGGLLAGPEGWAVADRPQEREPVRRA